MNLRCQLFSDHLGSYCAITDANKEVVQRNYFDPWGNFRLIYRTRNGFSMEEALPPTDSLEVGTIPSMNFKLTDRGFTGHEHYPYFKIINMNGRLYDPVIARFFSPDKFVQIPDFTQSFNRYSYCLNNPLQYVDPSGQMFFLPRLLSEAFTWIDDKMNGYTRPNGYFNWSYLSGRTEPGGFYNYNPVNAVPYGHSLYTPLAFGGTGSVRFGTGWAMGADNQWNSVFNEPDYSTDRIIQIKASTSNPLYSASLGLDPGKPIPAAYRNSKFVAYIKSVWFRYAPDPSGGYIISDLESGKSGSVTPDHPYNGKFTGGSTMRLDRNRAFTSIEQLFKTLGHELVHVAQFLALKGENFGLYLNPGFRDMLDFHAYSFVNAKLGGSYWENRLNAPFSEMDVIKNHYNAMNYTNFWWTKHAFFW